MNEAILNLTITLSGLIVSGAVTVAVAFLQSKLKSDRLSEALERVQIVSKSTVEELQQTVVDQWKTGGNKLSREQVKQLAEMSSLKIMSKIDEPGAKLIEAAGMDISELIQGFVEQKVYEIRNK